ncbi:hypothetical protein [Nocardioides daphniae]|uniref:Transposase n=1 Tax=Nocardioides daphniae TaxID=402297 RepID=A0A4P7UDA7_9ACTN|nr:hypothetical protein [Nocardioides daphniae]QCC76899.1 hypothetical protein E2C04_06105 [Nocardioides daphniae]GGD17533.1 hypothetical protein GCM10007231_15660 [Nocardioides daphniae]
MAKALLGHLHTDTRGSSRMVSENARLRQRIADLEALVVRLQDENTRLADLETTAALERESLQEMQPA